MQLVFLMGAKQSISNPADSIVKLCSIYLSGHLFLKNFVSCSEIQIISPSHFLLEIKIPSVKLFNEVWKIL